MEKRGKNKDHSNYKIQIKSLFGYVSDASDEQVQVPKQLTDSIVG